MAEVLGTAASALQVISIGADLGHALWKYAADFRKAGDDITAIALETDAIVKALRGLQPLLDEPGPHQSTALLRETAEVLSGCRGVFNELKAGLESWTRKGGNGKLPFWVRAQWPFRKQRLVVLQDMLSRYGQVLSLMLAVVQFAEGKKLATKEDLESLQTQLERLTLANQTLATSNETLSTSNRSLTQSLATMAPVQLASPGSNGESKGSSGAGSDRTSRDLAPVTPGSTAQSDQSTPQDPRLRDDRLANLVACKTAIQGLLCSLEDVVLRWQSDATRGRGRDRVRCCWRLVQLHMRLYLDESRPNDDPAMDDAWSSWSRAAAAPQQECFAGKPLRPSERQSVPAAEGPALPTPEHGSQRPDLGHAAAARPPATDSQPILAAMSQTRAQLPNRLPTVAELLSSTSDVARASEPYGADHHEACRLGDDPPRARSTSHEGPSYEHVGQSGPGRPLSPRSRMPDLPDPAVAAPPSYEHVDPSRSPRRPPVARSGMHDPSPQSFAAPRRARESRRAIMPVGRSSGPSATPAAPPRVLPLSPSVGSLGPGERGAPAALEWSEAEDAEVEVKAPRSAWTGAEGLSDGDDAEAEISEPDTWMFGSPFSAIGAGPELVATGPAGPLAAFERGGARVQGARRKRRREGGSGDEMGEHLRCCRKKRLRSRQDSGGDASVPWAGETTDEAEAPASRNGTLFQAGGVVAAELLRRWTRVEVLT